MKGNIQIIQSFGNEHKLLFEENNMSVDGFRAHIADVMTYMPNPMVSAGAVAPAQMAMLSGVSSVSSYQVQAFTLGCAKDYYNQRDTRFWFSSAEYSATNYRMLPLKDADIFEMEDCFSSIAYNSWRCNGSVSANILKSPTLENLDDWQVIYEEAGDAPISTRQEAFSQGTRTVTRCELLKGQQKITLRQQVPLRVGGDYFLYTNGKSNDTSIDFKICRGRNGVIFEYYDFETNRFVSKTERKDTTRHTISLKEYYDVDEFHFKVFGHEVDEIFNPNDEYYVDYVFPSKAFNDDSFAPWDEFYENPYVDIIRLELCDSRNQIIRNSSFLEHQSAAINSDFRLVTDLNFETAKNPDQAMGEGFKNILGWNQINPILNCTDPGATEIASGFGYVKPAYLNNFQDESFASMQDGIILHASSSDLTSSAGAGISQTINLGDDVRNNYAFPTATASLPSNIDQANGQQDNNSVFMLSLTTMVSGAPTAPNCGALEISLIRESDGFAYTFSSNNQNQSNQWSPEGIPARIPYSAKDVWLEWGVPVIFPADANRDSYTLIIKGTGRTDAAGAWTNTTDAMVNYAIKDFCFGPLEGWRPYVYDQSGIATWTLSSNSGYSYNGYGAMTSGVIYSGLSLSTHNTGDGARWTAGGDISKAYATPFADTRNAYKNQLVQNFVGMEPTKTYMLTVRGNQVQYAPEMLVSLKAKSRGNNILGGYNINTDTGQYSGITNPVSNLNPYSNDATSFRRTYANFAHSIGSTDVKANDWSVLVGPSGIQDGSQFVTESNVRGNAGNYFLSMDVFNEYDHGAYFMLSSASLAFFNWDNGEWDRFSTVSELPSYRSSTSGSYFLPLPSERGIDNFTSFRYPKAINFNSQALNVQTEQTPDNSGSRGEFSVDAAIYGPNSASGQTLVKNIKLVGPGVNKNVDIWKEKYYNWSTQKWEAPYKEGTFLSAISRDTVGGRNFCLQSPAITNMCFFGLDSDTEYQINLKDASGGNYNIHQIALTDWSLMNNKGSERWVRDAGVFTSEQYANAQYTSYTNGTVSKLYDNLYSNEADPSGFTNEFIPPSRIRFDNQDYNIQGGDNLVLDNQYVPYMRVDDFTAGTSSPWILRNLTLGEYGIEGGDDIAVGIDTALVIKSGTPKAYVSVEARYDGQPYHYSFPEEQWNPGSERREKVFDIKQFGVSGAGGDSLSTSAWNDVNQWSKIATPSFKAPSFGPETKLTVSVRIVPNDDNNSTVALKDFKMYRCVSAVRYDNINTEDANQFWHGDYRVSGDTFLFPEFPNPIDTSLQSRGKPGDSDEQGHFLNRINYFGFSAGTNWKDPGPTTTSSIITFNNPMSPSPTGERTMEEAVMMGSYLPSGGLWFNEGAFGTSSVSGLVSGVLNQMSVVNSDGYIYKHPYTTTHPTTDASAGFVTSSFDLPGFVGTYKPKVNRYILTLSGTDWKFLDYYMGGIGALGLHTFDYKKSYNKLNSTQFVSGTDLSYSTGDIKALYKLDDPKRNPVFRLTNKKVVFPPGLHIDYDKTDVITIIWDINLLT